MSLLSEVEAYPSTERDERSGIGAFLGEEEFFAPASSDLLTSILADYKLRRGYIDQIAEIVAGDLGGCVRYFIDGCREDSRYSPSVQKLFDKKSAYAALNSDFWSRTLAMTDVYDCMPQKRRDEWNKQIQDMKCVDFTEEAVRPTIESLLSMRSKFLAERVDGIFRNLSGEHVTNSPMGFGKRMIISYLTSYYGDKTGYINDLRCVIARFMGRDTPHWTATSNLIRHIKHRTGEWHVVDGGALRIKLFLKGTAHLEVHPDMAWRLNSVLASLYPHAIPSEFRTKPKKQVKSFAVMNRPLPFEVLSVIESGRFHHRDENKFVFPYESEKKIGYQEALRILISIGGVLDKHGNVEFGYDPRSVIAEILHYGCIPDQKSHQYYPTPESIAREVVALADIKDGISILEPSAGQGGLSDYLPKDQTTCVELSALHCKILEAKNFQVAQADFIDWAKSASKFDRIVMNPPFSEGRWKSHLEAAYSLLKQNGKLVAVLPSSAKGKTIFGNETWSGVYSGEFAGTGVSVAILTVEKL